MRRSRGVGVQRLEKSEPTARVQKDAFLVFRSLCKLSMKPLPEGAPEPPLEGLPHEAIEPSAASAA